MESPQQQTCVQRLNDLLARPRLPDHTVFGPYIPPSTHRPLRGLSSNQHATCSGGVLEAPPTSGRRATFLLRAGGEIPADPQRVSRPPLVRFLSSQRQPDQPVAPVCHNNTRINYFKLNLTGFLFYKNANSCKPCFFRYSILSNSMDERRPEWTRHREQFIINANIESVNPIFVIA